MDQSLGCRGIADFGPGDEIGEDVSAFGPGPKLSRISPQLRLADAGLQIFAARHQPGIGEIGSSLIDLGKVFILGIDDGDTILARQIVDPVDPVVVTVGSIHGGTKNNIIPDEVKMLLTVRTYKADVRERTLAAIDRIAKGIATTAGVPPERAPIVEVLKDEFTPATYNNPELTKRLVAVWKKVLGAQNVEATDPTMGGEDFSEYSLPDHSIPACDFHIGAVDPAKIAESKKSGVPLPSLHSSKFAPIPEPTIRVGVIAMTSAVLELMKK